MPRHPRRLIVVLVRTVGDKTVLDSFVVDMRCRHGKHDALVMVLSALAGGFNVLLIPQY